MSYKLHYYNGRGLAEPIRLILSYGGVEFEDIRAPLDKMPTPLDPAMKAKTTWGQVPLMEFEGKKLCQSLAITRYFAKKFNLVPKDDFEAALCDEYVDVSREILNAFFPIALENDEGKKIALLAEVKKSAHERYLSKLESIVKGNGGQRLVGKSMTWADIYMAHVLTNVQIINSIDILKDYPSLKALTDSVFNVPQIKAWIVKRPKTRF